jgi:hypothetical protein
MLKAQKSMFYQQLFPLKGADICVEVAELRLELRSSPIGNFSTSTGRSFSSDDASPSNSRLRSRVRRVALVPVANFPSSESRVTLFQLCICKISAALKVANRVSNVKLEVKLGSVNIALIRASVHEQHIAFHIEQHGKVVSLLDPFCSAHSI